MKHTIKLSDEKREELFNKQGGLCHKCNKNLGVLKELPIHLYPLAYSDGGEMYLMCRSCLGKIVSNALGNKKYPNKKAARAFYAKQRRKTIKHKAFDMLGNKCHDCGFAYNGNNAYLFDIHHLDPSLKLKSPSYHRSWKKLIKEIASCILLCAMCHRTRHWKMHHPED